MKILILIAFFRNMIFVLIENYKQCVVYFVMLFFIFFFVSLGCLILIVNSQHLFIVTCIQMYMLLIDMIQILVVNFMNYFLLFVVCAKSFLGSGNIHNLTSHYINLKKKILKFFLCFIRLFSFMVRFHNDSEYK